MERTTMDSGVSVSSGLTTLEWVKLKSLGKGPYGVVDLVEIIKPVPGLLAVKSSLSPSPSLQKEYRILRRFLGCPNIVQCYGEISSVECNVEYHNLFLDYAAGGNLLNLIDKYGGKIPESYVSCYTRMILEGLCDIHKRGYVHCDIRPENILVYPSRQSGSLTTLKIADFGSAKEPGERDTMSPPRPFRGSAHYMSPETVKHGKISASLDIWSLGCVIVEMMTGQPPWESSVTYLEDLAMKIAFWSDSPHIPHDMSMAGKDFLMRCFARDPRQRWSADRLLRHPFLFHDSTLMAVAPQNRILLPHALVQKFGMV